jgi:hypothetical protein
MAHVPKVRVVKCGVEPNSSRREEERNAPSRSVKESKTAEKILSNSRGIERESVWGVMLMQCNVEMLK